MGSALKWALPIGLGATGFGLAGMGPLAGVLGGDAAATAGAEAAAGGLLNPITTEGFGTANMFGLGGPAFGGAGVAETAANAVIPNLQDPLIQNGLWDGVGPIPNTIESAGLKLNPYTGGYDSLNGLQRFGQRLDGWLGSNVSTANKGPMDLAQQGLKFMNGNQQQPQMPKNVNSTVSAMPRGPVSPSAPGSFQDSANIGSVEPRLSSIGQQQSDEEKQRQMYLNMLGYAGK